MWHRTHQVSALPPDCRRHLNGTALAALAAADALQSTGRRLGLEDDPTVDGDWSQLWPGATAAIRAWALAAASDPASLPGGDAALAAVLEALPVTLVRVAGLVLGGWGRVLLHQAALGASAGQTSSCCGLGMTCSCACVHALPAGSTNSTLQLFISLLCSPLGMPQVGYTPYRTGVLDALAVLVPRVPW